MALSNLTQGNKAGLDTSVTFSATRATTTFSVDGLQTGNSSVVQFTVKGMDPSTYQVTLSADSTQVIVNTTSTVSKPKVQDVVYTVNVGQNEKVAMTGSTALVINQQNNGSNGTPYTFTKATGGGDA